MDIDIDLGADLLPSWNPLFVEELGEHD